MAGGAARPGEHPAPVVRGTAAWRYFGDFRGALLAGQVLLLQVAHPVVAAGVHEHSNYTEDPWTRLMRTAGSLSIYVYGGEDGARYEARRLRELHRAFTGMDEHGRRYSALNPEAYAWVHATLVKLPVDAQRFFGTALSRAELDEYYRQMCRIGRILGLREQDIPPDWDAFERYYAAMVDGFGPNRTITALLETIRTVAKPWPRLPDRLWLPLRRMQHRAQLFLIAGTLPPGLRGRLGLQWTAEQQRRLDRLARVSRALAAVIPVPLRSAHVRWVGLLNVWLRAHPRIQARLVRT